LGYQKESKEVAMKIAFRTKCSFVMLLILLFPHINSQAQSNKEPVEYGTVAGTLKGNTVNNDHLKFKLKPFATIKVNIKGEDRWVEALADYKEVLPDNNGKFLLEKVPVGSYTLRAVVGEAQGPSFEKVPVWAFIKSGGNVVNFSVKANTTIDLGVILVDDK
jgi:hypothetical protein